LNFPGLSFLSIAIVQAFKCKVQLFLNFTAAS